MNTVLTFLRENRQRLNLGTYGVPESLNCILLTPRFRASSNVVFLIIPDDQVEPVLVAKVPRLEGASEGAEREASNLQAVQSLRPGGFDSIPRVVAFESYYGYPILVETALTGQPMSPAMVRRDPLGCCNLTIKWLVDVQQASTHLACPEATWFERLVEQPLRYLAKLLPTVPEEAQLLEQTRTLLEPLRGTQLPLVFEHGDLSHPNIFLLQNGRAGVVDWELAEPRGLPTYDLFFFLTYVTFARHNVHSNERYLPSYRAAFFGHDGWARPYIARYAEQLSLPQEVLTPLLVLCWARYLSTQLTRIVGVSPAHEQVGHNTAAWLRTNRYYALWEYTVNHVNDLW